MPKKKTSIPTGAFITRIALPPSIRLLTACRQIGRDVFSEISNQDYMAMTSIVVGLRKAGLTNDELTQLSVVVRQNAENMAASEMYTAIMGKAPR